MKKGRILNFEILWDTDEGLVLLAEKYIPMDIQKAADEGCTHVVGIVLNEGILPFDDRNLQQFFYNLHKQTNELGIELVILSSLGEQFKNITVPFEIQYFPYYARFVYNNYKKSKLPLYDNKDKFLFLGGAATRPNRIGLLSKFYDAGLLDRAEWSFFKPTYADDVKWCRDHLKRYSDKEYSKFIDTVERSIDDRYNEVKLLIKDAEETYGDWHDIVNTKFFKRPGYLTPKVFEDTHFSILSEGPNFWSDDYAFITEKTWRTIINRHPFIFAGPAEQFNYIKSLGFKTFEDYLPIKDYAYIQDEDKRFDAIVENTKYLLDNHSQGIAADVEHNYKRYMEIIKEQDILFTSLEKDMAVPRSEIDYYLDNEGLDHLIREKNE